MLPLNKKEKKNWAEGASDVKALKQNGIYTFIRGLEILTNWNFWEVHLHRGVASKHRWPLTEFKWPLRKRASGQTAEAKEENSNTVKFKEQSEALRLVRVTVQETLNMPVAARTVLRSKGEVQRPNRDAFPSMASARHSCCSRISKRSPEGGERKKKERWNGRRQSAQEATSFLSGPSSADPGASS